MGKINLANLKKTVYYLRRNGLKDTFTAALERFADHNGETYAFREPAPELLKRQREHEWAQPPMFSILVPLYRTPERYLREMAESVLNQTYSRLELILTDATEDDSVEKQVRALMEKDKRIRYQRLERNEGISGNSNQALKLVTGDYVGLLDHDDVLSPQALYKMAEQIERGIQAGRRPYLLYSDEDKCNQDRTVYYEPHYKPDFNLDLLLSNNYICHFLVMETDLIQSLGFRREYDGAQDYDLVLRAVSRILMEGGEKNAVSMQGSILHIPQVLYHWRCHTGSTAQNPASKQYAYEAGRRALQDMADRMGWRAFAVHLKHLGFYGLSYEPELMSVRKDVGAVGGRITAHGRVLSGAFDEQGEIMYRGLRAGYSGYMHRGVLLQDVAAADIRLIRVNPQCRELFERVTGTVYRESEGRLDLSVLPEGTDFRELSLRLGKALRAAGYLVCFDPQWSMPLKRLK